MLQFELIGRPLPQERTRFSKQGRVYNPSKPYEKHIQWQAAFYAPEQPLSSAIQLDLTFYFEPPKSASAMMRRQMLNHVIHHKIRPDIDNCAYVVTNALKKLFYVDDSQIIDLSVHKRYGHQAKTVVRITPIEEIAPTRGLPIE